MYQRKISILLSGVGLTLSLAGCGTAAKDTVAEETGEAKEALAGQVYNVLGDTSCPSGYTLASPEEVRDNASTVCGMLGAWDIARLANGGSMDGPAYGCTIRTYDARGMGNSVCKQVQQFTEVLGDGSCPAGLTLVSPLVARASQSDICSQLGTWDIVRLANGGAMDGPGYGCGIRDLDTRTMGNTLCAQMTFTEVLGDTPCPPGTALLSPTEAEARQSEVCALLAPWDVARLAGGGAMDGSGYGCGIRYWDTRSLGNALCQAL
ncbi:hypothetical protein [Comamonas sp. JC664]|uniref:hypothetical protein n=1 Tax=Comamonas sp. JC664 TaxID=2801917 RepID=UPI00174D57A9|nr:hypothetical protein [Comamonas sp. JC664]MBL0695553.1 hypothetical protein [Comamonas sp. JC664]GHG62197.1 hypothetical protein GCM10012319_00680 [Comamonas sp. KCTC 72670]